jgi:hypothetical protein
MNAAALFSARDPDGDPIITYTLWQTPGGGGQLQVAGVAQPAGRNIDLTAAQLAQTTYRAGGDDDVWVRVSDRAATSQWLDIHITGPVNHAPTVTASDVSLGRGATVAAGSLFTASDADGDPLTYTLWQAPGGGGQLLLNGVAQAAGRNFDLTAAQLAQTTYRAGGADDLWVRVGDGSAMSSWVEFHVTGPVNHAPTVTASDIALARGETAAGALFSATDPDGDAIVAYRLWEAPGGGGRFFTDGVADPIGVNFDLTPAQLAQTVFQNDGGTSDLWVQVNDGSAWSSWTQFHVTGPVNHASIVTATDQVLAPGATVAAASLFSTSDADGGPVALYRFWVGPDSGGRFVTNGTPDVIGRNFDLTAAQLAQTNFENGGGTSDLWVQVHDGTSWSGWTEFHVSTGANHAPTLVAADQSIAHARLIPASSLFTASDPDHQALSYTLFVEPGGGSFVTNGSADPVGQEFTLTAPQLAQTQFEAPIYIGTIDTTHVGQQIIDTTETTLIRVRTSDGAATSDWAEFHLTTAPDPPTVVVGADGTVAVTDLGTPPLFGGSGGSVTIFVGSGGTVTVVPLGNIQPVGDPGITITGASAGQGHISLGSGGVLTTASFDPSDHGAVTVASAAGLDPLWVRTIDPHAM